MKRAAGIMARVLAAPAPALQLVSRTPLTVAGAHFAPRSRVEVNVGGVSLTTRASANGGFRVVVKSVRLGSCTTAKVRAVGAGGQHASMAVPAAGCMTARG
ncbi:MAG: hypothetical protein JO186_00180 [Actinobacteria bacterium]|nr:hypothetical protein [Actinomycetota bacterium]MBV8395472.1 hypothetical protein [Actinomycetota bacterium]MBV8597981.1 hypothetical protein [Actinomycetota bacterium]